MHKISCERDYSSGLLRSSWLGMDFWLIDFGLAVSSSAWRGQTAGGGPLLSSFHGHEGDAMWKQHDIVGTARCGNSTIL